MKITVVAKYLCSYGQNEKYINFEKNYNLYLEREPQNQYDKRAIKVVIEQDESDLILRGYEKSGEEADEN